MNDDAASGAGRVASTDLLTLRRIADTLGLPVAALVAPAGPHVLHIDASGACWLLLRDGRGTPVVRHLAGRTEEGCMTEVSVPVFLARDVESPQRRALATLIDKALSAYLTS